MSLEVKEVKLLEVFEGIFSLIALVHIRQTIVNIVSNRCWYGSVSHMHFSK